MKWNTQQEQALRDVGRWFRDPSPRKPQIFRLFGYAGTGKTTLAKTIDEDLTGGGAQFMAYTGKAASVLQQKGCRNADTIHGQIYNPKEKSKARLRDLEALLAKLEADVGNGRIKKELAAKEKAKLERDIGVERDNISRPSWAVNLEAAVKDKPLLILDEVSMVDARVAEDILSFKIPILALGDPAQLPPVRGGGYFTDAKPDVMLTDVQRQAKDNPIIQMATLVREGGSLSPGRYGSSLVMPRSGLRAEHVTTSDQLLVGRNVTRKSCNARFRQLRGLTEPLPVESDLLVCLRNNRELGVLNGVQYVVRGSSDPGEGYVYLDAVEPVSGFDYQFTAHSAPFLNDEVPFWEKKEHEEFDYGYALTVHKAQGSQWNSVTIFDEWFANSRQQWLYTAITRAAEQLTVVQF